MPSVTRVHIQIPVSRRHMYRRLPLGTLLSFRTAIMCVHSLPAAPKHPKPRTIWKMGGIMYLLSHSCCSSQLKPSIASLLGEKIYLGNIPVFFFPYPTSISPVHQSVAFSVLWVTVMISPFLNTRSPGSVESNVNTART